ncbi:hypothetical protein N7537_010011 [Penicillium hordei]|uniref:Uncharacterized protein n=1 Tax=Penicillium hordei TaxID=40994 RepID=A0AAD6DU04_9EURO|nr:uncharacterized protein N7537_010011 [Penicillium hordei]KAJ5593107.1 hypothetical protein N7537_010011 [Penicillium hordei]
MPQSQQIGVGSSQSSIFDSEADDLLLVTPSASQQAFNSFDSSFAQPSVPSYIAPHPIEPFPLERFQRVGPGKRGQYFLYDVMSYRDWVNWWLQTDYGSNSKINWDSHGRAKIWKEFEQVAHTVHDTAKVMCKNCGVILEHPSATKNSKHGRHGTTTMIRYVTTSACKRAGDANSQPFSQEAWDNELLRFITINGLRLISSRIQPSIASFPKPNPLQAL